MTRFEQIRDPSGDSRLADLYRQIVDAGFGREYPLNWFTSQAGRPDILAATWKLVRGLLVGGELPPTLKQMIFVRVSHANRCRYCQVIHSDALAALGVPVEVIDSVTTEVSPQKLPPVQRAIVSFAAKVAANPKTLTQEDFEELWRYGLSHAEIMEAAMIGALANFVNSWADVSGIGIEREEGAP